MKTLTLKILLVLLPIAGAMANGQAIYNGRKEFQHKVSATGALDIYNKYGKVVVKNWDKDSVKIVIDYSISAKNDSKLESAIFNLKFDNTHSLDYVSCRTVFGNKDIGKQTKWMLDDMIGVSDVTVNYKIYLPASNSLEIENSFGDVVLEDRIGETTINLSHGDLIAGDFVKKAKLTNSYGKIRVEKANYLSLKASHCKGTSITKADFLYLKSSFSEIRIIEANRIKLNSKKDKISIDQVGKIYGKCSLPEMHIYELTKSVNLSSSLPGTIVFDKIKKSFTEIILNTKFTDIELRFEPTSFQTEIIHKTSQITYPTRIVKLTTIDDPSDKKTRITKGLYGSSTSTTKSVNIKADNADLLINNI
jgi:hypothetical protein